MTMKRILTGDRPTGRLHIGHYVGSLSNRVKLQHDYDTFIEIADIQALTTHFERPELISDSIMQVAIDNLSVGLDPEKVTLFLQSQIPSIAELTIFYSMFVTMNTLRHNPTVKTEAAQYGYDDMTYGFIGYPVSQAADITFCNADLVPVGEDQKPHIELARKLVRRFNGGEASVFLISLRAGGTGLNLTAADIVIHYDPWWNVAAQNQATDRAYRIGQQNPVQVYKLIAQDTIEEKIVELQQAKQDLAETVTGSADGAILRMKPEELLNLLEGTE